MKKLTLSLVVFLVALNLFAAPKAGLTAKEIAEHKRAADIIQRFNDKQTAPVDDLVKRLSVGKNAAEVTKAVIMDTSLFVVAERLSLETNKERQEAGRAALSKLSESVHSEADASLLASLIEKDVVSTQKELMTDLFKKAKEGMSLTQALEANRHRLKIGVNESLEEWIKKLENCLKA